MYEKAHRRAVCLSNSEAGQRYTPREKGHGRPLQRERRSAVSQKLGRDTPGEGCGHLSEEELRKEVM